MLVIPPAAAVVWTTAGEDPGYRAGQAADVMLSGVELLMREAITIRVIGSGSTGNCLFVRVGQTRLLIDVGISLRQVRAALAEIDESLGSLDAILITHEHTDHVCGLAAMRDARPELDAFATRGTQVGCARYVDEAFGWKTIRAEAPFEVGGVRVTPFALSHDAKEPVGFRLDADGFSMALATDLGAWDAATLRHLSGARLLILEANHDLHMLRTGPYPLYLQKRVASNRGHLSNEQARALLSRLPAPLPEVVILAHLSQKNNTAALALAEVGRALGEGAKTRLIAAGASPGDPLVFERSQATAPAGMQGLLFSDC